MTGFLRSQGIEVSEMRLHALRNVNPRYHNTRSTVTTKADYFGHKVHIDQNEKLVMFGVTHACARVVLICDVSHQTVQR